MLDKGPPRKKARTKPLEADFVSPLIHLPGQLSVLPPNVIEIIVDYLPAYHFFGRKSIHGVNKLFNQTAKLHKFTCRKKLDALIASCISPNDAVTILGDESIINQLNFDTIIKIASYHEELVRYMLTIPKICQHLGYNVVELGIKYPSLVPLILSMPEHHTDLMVALAAKNPAKAQEIINTPLICDMLEKHHLVRLGLHNFVVAQHILDTPALRAKVNIYFLCSNHPALAENLISTQEWTPDNAYHLVELGADHLSVAKLIIDTSRVCDELSGQELGRLCAYHIELSQYVLDTRRLWQRLDGRDLEWVGMHHTTIAQQIFCRPELYNQLTGSSLALLGIENKAGAELILNTPHLCKKLLENSMDLARLGVRDLAIAQKILDRPDLRDQLEGKSLAYLGSSHIPIAEQIFKSEPLCNKLNGEHIITLGLTSSTLAKYILDTPVLCNKLSSRDIGRFGLSCVAFLELILARPHLSDKISVDDCMEILFRVDFTAQIKKYAQKLNQANSKRTSSVFMR